MINRRALVCATAVVLQCLASSAATAQDQPEPFAITDNSFFIEEAFNQERGIFQNILIWEKTKDGGWDGSFTQEFPAPAMRHQLSYTIPFDGGSGIGAHVGTAYLNYRFQVLEEGAGRPAFAPRFSVLLPTGRDGDGDRSGMQVNLPFSKQVGDIYLHANAGFTRVFGVPLDNRRSDTTALTSPSFGGSVIYRLTPMLNVMLESLVTYDDRVIDGRTGRERSGLLSPGFRTGWNVGEDKQVVIGAAAPITFEGGERTFAVLGYLSYELPFTSKR